MGREDLTGSRIRERRIMQGVKQGDLAKQIGISASYLNLIEHNRRRIGGKLLLALAAALEVEPQALTEGAEVALLGVLGEAAAAANLSAQDAEGAEAFAGRFPAWAEALAASQRRISALERTVETLTDRMAHDPMLADKVHELLTTAAAVRSTAEILTGDEVLEREWQERFYANLDDDSLRLAQSAHSLVVHLEKAQGETNGRQSAQEEVDAFLERHGYNFAALEGKPAQTAVEGLLGQAAQDLSAGAQFILRGILEQIHTDAKLLPLAKLEAAVAQEGVDPLALSRLFSVPPAVILRRLAAVPTLRAGLVVCDRAGAIVFGKGVNGFTVPRFDSCCPLWPLFSAVSSGGGAVMHERLVQLGRGDAQFDAYAAADLGEVSQYNTVPAAHAVMLLIPVSVPQAALPARDVGVTCRVCALDNCSERRELSILHGH